MEYNCDDSCYYYERDGVVHDDPHLRRHHRHHPQFDNHGDAFSVLEKHRVDEKYGDGSRLGGWEKHSVEEKYGHGDIFRGGEKCYEVEKYDRGNLFSGGRKYGHGGHFDGGERAVEYKVEEDFFSRRHFA